MPLQGIAKGAMADLPQLPDRVRRKLALLWDALIEKHGFNGEHLNWTVTRQRKITFRSPQPPADIHNRTVRYIQERTAQAAPIYAHADTIGIDETGMLAAERYAQLAEEYLSVWLTEQGRRSDVFTVWLVELRATVADEVAQLWKERGDWFERVCRAKLDSKLTPMFDQLRRKAREFEIADLAPENISFELLMAQAHEALERSERVMQQYEKALGEQPPNALPKPNEPVPERPPLSSGISPESGTPETEGSELRCKPVARDRTALLDDFKVKAREGGLKVTDKMVARAANPGKWNDRTIVAWWKRNDPKSTPGHDKKIRALLARDPASIWSRT
jgi:hypothetical protein